MKKIDINVHDDGKDVDLIRQMQTITSNIQKNEQVDVKDLDILKDVKNQSNQRKS